ARARACTNQQVAWRSAADARSAFTAYAQLRAVVGTRGYAHLDGLLSLQQACASAARAGFVDLAVASAAATDRGDFHGTVAELQLPRPVAFRAHLRRAAWFFSRASAGRAGDHGGHLYGDPSAAQCRDEVELERGMKIFAGQDEALARTAWRADVARAKQVSKVEVDGNVLLACTARRALFRPALVRARVLGIEAAAQPFAAKLIV